MINVSFVLTGGDDSPASRSFHPVMVTPAPPLFLDEEELAWINPTDLDSHLDFVFDKSISEANASANEARRSVPLNATAKPT